jgi:hypothetical protein
MVDRATVSAGTGMTAGPARRDDAIVNHAILGQVGILGAQPDRKAKV